MSQQDLNNTHQYAQVISHHLTIYIHNAN